MLNDSIIEDIFYAEKYYLENIPKGEQHDELMSKLAEYDRDLRTKLKDAPILLDLYQRIDDIQTKFYCYAEKHFFVFGFKFGFKLAMDILL